MQATVMTLDMALDPRHVAHFISTAVSSNYQSDPLTSAQTALNICHHAYAQLQTQIQEMERGGGKRGGGALDMAPAKRMAPSGYANPGQPAYVAPGGGGGYVGGGYGQMAPREPKADPHQPTRNLHVSQFGQGCTREQITQVFSQYAELREVIMKEGYCFVNTVSVEAATHARENLTGHNLMGGALLINFAKDRERGGGGGMGMGMGMGGPSPWGGAQRTSTPHNPSQPTRNLHVSAFGPGATREQVQATFAQYVEVREVIMKEGYCFVNTVSVEGATAAMENLQGSVLNGGYISINYARDREQTGGVTATRTHGYAPPGGAVAPGGAGMVAASAPPLSAPAPPGGGGNAPPLSAPAGNGNGNGAIGPSGPPAAQGGAPPPM